MPTFTTRTSVILVGAFGAIALAAFPGQVSADSHDASPPRADFEWLPAAPRSGELVEFRDLSLDDVGIVAWSWSFEADAEATERHPTHAFARPGSYSVTLEVADAAGNRDAITRAVDVLNRPPLLALEISLLPGRANAILARANATDPDGLVGSIEWSFGDGRRASGQEVTHVYRGTGTFAVEAEARDDLGATGRASGFATIAVPPPSASIDIASALPKAGAPLLVSAEVTAATVLASQRWEILPPFGAPEGIVSAEGPNVTRVPAWAGSYTFRFTVEDEVGQLATATRTVVVPPGPIQALVDAAFDGDVVTVPPGAHAESVLVTKPVTLDGRGLATIDGRGAAPALAIVGARVELRDLTLASVGAPTLVAARAPSLALRNVTSVGLAPSVTDVAWVLSVTPPGGHLPLDLTRAAAAHAHPVKLRALDASGAPVPGATIEVRDGDGPVRAFVASAAGEATVEVVHLSEIAGEPRDNATWASVRGSARAPVFVETHREGALLLVLVEASQTDAEPASILEGVWSSPASIAVAVALPAVVAVGASAAVAFRANEHARWRFLALFAPLFTRLARSEILEHGLREAIFGHIEANPGVTFSELKRDLAVKHGTLLHHLRILEQSGFIRSVKDGPNRRFYATGRGLPVEGAPALADVVLRHVASHPGITNDDLARELAKRPSLVHYHVQRLAEAGHVRKEKDGKRMRLYATRSGARGPGTAPSAAGDVPPPPPAHA